MGTSANNLQSFRPYHPGELIKEELECRNVKQKDFAKKKPIIGITGFFSE